MNKYNRTGHTLTGTMIFLVLVTLLWTGTINQLMNYIRIEKKCSDKLDFTQTCTKATAWAITLLQTGRPETSHYSYLAEVSNQADGTYVICYSMTADDTWQIDVRPATSADMSLDIIPETFNTTENISDNTDS